MKNLITFLSVTLVAPAVFAWGSYTNDFICKSKSVEAHICHSAAQADGGETGIRKIVVKGKALTKGHFSVKTDGNGTYQMATMIIAEVNHTSPVRDLSAMTFVLGTSPGEIEKDAYVLIRDFKNDTLSVEKESITCEQVDLRGAAYCGSN